MLKVVSNKLASTNDKIKKEWQRYGKTKASIKRRKGLTVFEKEQILSSELDLTKSKISDFHREYREFKFSKENKSPHSGFDYTNKLTTKNGYQEIFKAKKNFDTDNLDNIISDALENDRAITGILVVFEVENEQGLKSFVSNYITRDLLDRIMEYNENFGEGAIFDYVTERLNAGYKEGLKLRFIYMRIIYANTKNSNN